MNKNYVPIINFLGTHSSFAIVGHEDPDGDCLYSQLTLASLINRLGKTSCVVSPGPFDRGEIRDIEQCFTPSVAQCVERPDAVIVVDCSTLERTGPVAEEISGLPTAVIDHHAAGEEFGDVRYIDPEAPSVTYLLLELMHAVGVTPTAEEADWLLFGLCTDTGYFRHLSEGRGDVFRTVAELVDAGASTKSVYYRMFGNKQFSSRKLLGRMLERTESKCDGRLLVTWEEPGDSCEFENEHRDSDTLYRELQSIGTWEVIVLVRPEKEQTCSVGLRSLDSFDVGALARSHGGGGHKNAAGFSADGNVEEVKHAIVSQIEAMLA